MAINWVLTYAGRVDAADAEYPYGKPRNRVSPGDGTPFDEAAYRDIAGSMAAAMRQSGITAATNVPEKVGASQVLQGIARHIAGGSNFMIDSGVADAYVVDVPGVAPNIFESPSVLFDGMRVTWVAANANTGASTLDVEFQGVSISSPQTLTLEGGTALSGGEIDTITENEARFDLGNARFELIRAAGVNAAIPASQAQQVAGASNAVFATPANQQFHKSAAKAWARYDNVAVTPTLDKTYNVSSLTDNGTGDATLNFTNNMADVNSVAHGTAYKTSALTQVWVSLKTALAASVRMQNSSFSGTTAIVASSTDTDITNVTVHGDLA